MNLVGWCILLPINKLLCPMYVANVLFICVLCVFMHAVVYPDRPPSYVNENVYSRMLEIRIAMYFHACPLQEKLREAAKARLRRMCANHRSRRDLELPAWVKSEWKTRPQNETAKLFMDCNWCKAGYQPFMFVASIMLKHPASFNILFLWVT